MQFTYDSRSLEHKTPYGAVRPGTPVTFRVVSDADRITLAGFGAPVEMAKDSGEFTAEVAPGIDIGRVFYHFEAMKGGKRHTFGRGKGGRAEKNGAPYQLTVHQNLGNPDWFTGGVIYQIYVDRFFKAESGETRVRDHVLMHTSWSEKPVYIRNEKNEIVLWDFFGGNLEGVIQKLDYISSLGVSIIYLNPIFESISNHTYDTADYNAIDRMYGTDETIKRLVNEAGKRGIKIMLDGVFSHTGDDSIFFNKYKTYGEGGAYNDKKSLYYEWFSFDRFPDKYDCWWGVTSLPCVNELAPSYLDYLLNPETGAVVKWMRLGIAGWRLDVADELPDEFIQRLKETVLSVNPQAVLLGEVWEDASNKVSYGKPRSYILTDSLDSVSNYPLRDGLISLLTGKSSPEDFGETVSALQENYPPNVFTSLMNMTGTHDTTRLMTLLGDAPAPSAMTTWQQREYALSQGSAALAMQRLGAYFVVLFTLPGNPCIYYGDELGLQGYKDPYNRGTFDWDSDETQLIDLIQQLSALRKKLGIAACVKENSPVRFHCEGRLLRFSIDCEKSGYTVTINMSRTPKQAGCNGKDVCFAHSAAVGDTHALLRPYGAVVQTV